MTCALKFSGDDRELQKPGWMQTLEKRREAQEDRESPDRVLTSGASAACWAAEKRAKRGSQG